MQFLKNMYERLDDDPDTRFQKAAHLAMLIGVLLFALIVTSFSTPTP